MTSSLAPLPLLVEKAEVVANETDGVLAMVDPSSALGLFLFGQGLGTFAGPHVNRELLFLMEDVFEDFVTAAVRRHQRRFTVRSQGPKISVQEGH